MLASFDTAIRYFQGERPGMHAGVIPGPLHAPAVSSQIVIQQVMRLVDVSFWQGEIDFVKMSGEGIAGAIIRAGQRTWIDSRFKVNWSRAKLAGLPRGSYWFYDSREDPIKQAQLWYSLIQYDTGELVHVADFEESYGGPFGKAIHFRLFMTTIMNLTKLPASKFVVYTGYYWWTARVGNDIFFKQFKVWIAWYSAMAYVQVPMPWTEKDLLFWQYTSSGDGTLYGVSSLEIDLNYYCCSTTEFLEYFQLVPPILVPDEGGFVMDYYELRSNSASSRSIRSGPSVKHDKIGDLLGGQVARNAIAAENIYVYATNVSDVSFSDGYLARAGDTWRKVYEVDGKPVEGWIAEIHKLEVLLNKNLVRVGDTQYGDVPMTIEVGDDLIYEKQTVSIILKAKR